MADQVMDSTASSGKDPRDSRPEDRDQSPHAGSHALRPEVRGGRLQDGKDGGVEDLADDVEVGVGNSCRFLRVCSRTARTPYQWVLAVAFQ
jgi:hypothetical protein